MTHTWIHMLAASLVLASAASAQQADLSSAPATSSDIEPAETASLFGLLSVADYESGQTGGVVDAKAAAIAMAHLSPRPAEELQPGEGVSEYLLSAEALNAVPMDSDDVRFTIASGAPGGMANMLEDPGTETADE